MTAATTADILHASAVSILGQCVLILGPSGTGKSALALDLMSRGAGLVSDDRTQVRRVEGVVIASAPKALQGLIEARGAGLLTADYSGPTPVKLVVDLAQKSVARLPDQRQFTVLNVDIDLICGQDLPNLTPVIIQYFKGGRGA